MLVAECDTGLTADRSTRYCSCGSGIKKNRFSTNSARHLDDIAVKVQITFILGGKLRSSFLVSDDSSELDKAFDLSVLSC